MTGRQYLRLSDPPGPPPPPFTPAFTGISQRQQQQQQQRRQRYYNNTPSTPLPDSNSINNNREDWKCLEVKKKEKKNGTEERETSFAASISKYFMKKRTKIEFFCKKCQCYKTQNNVNSHKKRLFCDKRDCFLIGKILTCYKRFSLAL